MESLLYLGGWQWGFGGEGRVDSCPKADSPPHPTTSRARAFIDRRRGLRAETAQAALTVILKSVLRWSDQHHLDYTVNLQLQGRFVPISLRAVLGIVAAHVMATAWSSCS